jgi:hypothetical protein
MTLVDTIIYQCQLERHAHESQQRSMLGSMPAKFNGLKLNKQLIHSFYPKHYEDDKNRQDASIALYIFFSVTRSTRLVILN